MTDPTATTTAVPSESELVFNITWTGSVFPYLRYFVASQIRHTTARFRFLVNGCDPGQIELMERFAEYYPDRITDILETSEVLVGHGFALNTALDLRDDGDYFCMIDPDIMITDSFLPYFAERMQGSVNITSGRGVWRDDDLVPEGQRGVSGEFFYSRDGFLFGCPHFAIYRRAQLEATMAKWDIGFGTPGPDLSDAGKAELERLGLGDFWLFDTGKIVNVFLQVDGHVTRHDEHPAMMHIGGTSHYFSLPDGKVPDSPWQKWDPDRFEVAQYTGLMIRHLGDGRAPLEVPEGLDPSMTEKLVTVRNALVDLVQTYGPEMAEIDGAS